MDDIKIGFKLVANGELVYEIAFIITDESVKQPYNFHITRILQLGLLTSLEANIATSKIHQTNFDPLEMLNGDDVDLEIQIRCISMLISVLAERCHITNKVSELIKVERIALKQDNSKDNIELFTALIDLESHFKQMRDEIVYLMQDDGNKFHIACLSALVFYSLQEDITISGNTIIDIPQLIKNFQYSENPISNEILIRMFSSLEARKPSSKQ